MSIGDFISQISSEVKKYNLSEIPLKLKFKDSEGRIKSLEVERSGLIISNFTIISGFEIVLKEKEDPDIIY